MQPGPAELHLGGDASAARHRRRGRNSQVAFVLVCLAAALVAGCGESGDTSDPGSSALGSPDLQTSAREADCADWNAASTEDRRVIIDSIAEFEGGGPTGTQGRFLPEDQTYDVFERTCEQDYASAFKLYKVYVRAAAFSGGP